MCYEYQCEILDDKSIDSNLSKCPIVSYFIQAAFTAENMIDDPKKMVNLTCMYIEKFKLQNYSNLEIGKFGKVQ